jgi:hypothetical protein
VDVRVSICAFLDVNDLGTNDKVDGQTNLGATIGVFGVATWPMETNKEGFLVVHVRRQAGQRRRANMGGVGDVTL